MLNFAENPAASPVEEDGVINAIVGEKVVIKFYASGIPPPSIDYILWVHNNSSNITWGKFSEDKKSLTIPNIQPSHAGEYKFILYYPYNVFVGLLNAVATMTVTVKSEWFAI